MHSIPSISYELPEEPVMDPCCMRCQECGEVKTNSNKLYDHLFEHHNYDKSRIDNIKQQRKMRSTQMKALRNSKNLLICEICRKPFLSRTGLLNHKQKEHGYLPNDGMRIQCPQLNCGSRFFTYKELAVHADAEHSSEAINRNSFCIHRKQFSDTLEMRKWRSEMEYETDTRFVMRSSETKFTYGKRVEMWICANGYTRKKNVSFRPCPAFLRICELHCGTFDVVACFGHLGHSHSSLRISATTGKRLDDRRSRETVMPRHSVLVKTCLWRR